MYIPSTSAPCPTCGHCPTCGRGGYHTYPIYPTYPYVTWGTGTATNEPGPTWTYTISSK